MSIDTDALKRVLSMRLIFEGGSSWAVRELIDAVEDYLMERLPMIVNSLIEPFGLEASVLRGDPCRLFPGEACNQLVVVGLYAGDTGRHVGYVLYRLIRGENTFEFSLYRLVEAAGGE